MILDQQLQDTYDILEEIGSGGGGTVFKAFHKRLRKVVVIKRQHDSIRGLLNERTETDLLKNLRHTYLPQVLDFIVTDSAVYTVMDYIPGGSIQDVIKAQGYIPEDRVAKYARQLCEALAYLHDSNPPIIHGDIKPDNIMLTEKDDICLIDFNISSALGGESAVTMGYTAGYAPPEQIQAFEIQKQRMQEQRMRTMNQGQSMGMPVNQPVQDVGATVLTGQGMPQTMYGGTAGPQGTVVLDAGSGNAGYGGNGNTGYTGMTSEGTMLLGGGAAQAPTPNPYNQQTPYNPYGNGGMVNANYNMGPMVTATGQHITFDKRSDIYSFGATLYHMLTGQKPHPDPMQIIPIKEILPKLNEGLNQVIMKSLSYYPQDRFQSFDEIRQITNNLEKYELRYKVGVAKKITTTLVVAGAVLVACVGAGLFLSSSLKKSNAAVINEAQQLYNAGEYVQAAELLDQEVIASDFRFLKRGIVSDAYYICGRCWMEMGDYSYAVELYEKALELNDQNIEVYTNCAIAMAKIGDLYRAQEVLNRAKENGVYSREALLAEAEIANYSGNKEKARELYRECIDQNTDERNKMLAFLAMADLADRYTFEGLTEKIDVLTEAFNTLSAESRIPIDETLAQAYIDRFDMTDNEADARAAASVLNDLVKNGWDSFVTHNNLIVLYQKIDDYDSALAEIEVLQKRYPDDYRTYKLAARLEIDMIFAGIPGTSIDHFIEYYDKAMELYKQTDMNDPEMNVLETERTRLGN